jgi:uncharacterized membrane protein
MTGQGKLVAGVIVGAGVMYLLDPDQGARRRALLQERGARLRWTPATRLVVGATGSALTVQGVRLNGLRGRALTFLGSGLLSRAASQMPSPRPIEESRETESPAESVTSRATEPVPVAKSTPKRRRSRR